MSQSAAGTSSLRQTAKSRRTLLQVLLGVGITAGSFGVGFWLMRAGGSGAGGGLVANDQPLKASEMPERDTIVDRGGPMLMAGPVVPAEGRSLPALHGGIGLGTWDTAAQFKDILVQSAEKKALLGGELATGPLLWEAPVGQWDVAGGVLTQASRSISCKATTGNTDWSDYTYSLKARRTDGTEGFLIIFAVQSSSSLTWWNIGGWGNTRAAIEKTTNGAKREIPGTAVEHHIETNQWYDIRIELRGETFNCYLDGKLITTVENGIGHSTLPAAGAPRIVNNGNGPEAVGAGRTTLRGTPGTPRRGPTSSPANVPGRGIGAMPMRG